MPIKDIINTALRRATGYSLTRETPEERARVIANAKAVAARRARRNARAQERKSHRERTEVRQRERAQRLAAAQREREERLAQQVREREERRASGADLPGHFDDDKRAIIVRVRDWTMTDVVKLDALIEATRYITRHGIPGDIVECGVWRGGSTQAMALTLMSMGDTSRELHLFDTFEGMPPPTEEDTRTRWGNRVSAADLLASSDRDAMIWAVAGLDLVKEGMAGTSYPADKVHYHMGRVEETTPSQAPEQIAILRLDTDWYASTKHELEHLYPRLSPGGVLILDDYASFDGARKATDEWLEQMGVPFFLAAMGGGRIAAKPFQ